MGYGQVVGRSMEEIINVRGSLVLELVRLGLEPEALHKTIPLLGRLVLHLVDKS